MPTFIEQCLSGKLAPEDVDDFVEAWHSSIVEQPLHEFLGFDDAEYELWLQDAGSLTAILRARRLGIGPHEAHDKGTSVAGRA